jgi:hypothetical protein
MAQVAAPLTCNPTLELLERKVVEIGGARSCCHNASSEERREGESAELGAMFGW